MGLSVNFNGKDIPAMELIFRRSLGRAAEVYLTVPVVDIDNSYNLDSELKEFAVSIEDHKIFPCLLISEIRGTPFFSKESSVPLTRAWYIKARLKDIFTNYKLGPDLHNKIIVKKNLMEVFDELNEPKKFFRLNGNLETTIQRITPVDEKKPMNIIQYRKNTWKMFEHLMGMYNQLVSPEEAITCTETDNGIGGFEESDEFCELTYLQAKKNEEGGLLSLEETLFNDKDVKSDLYFSEGYKHRLHGHWDYARCLSYYVNLYEHFDITSESDLLETFKAPCPSFFKKKFVCEIFHSIKYQDATFVDWNCSIITLQNNEQILDSSSPEINAWRGKGKVTERDATGPWLKVKLEGFESDSNIADVYVTTPYSGDGQSNKIGFHLTPEKDSIVLVKTGADCAEPIYLDSNLSNHPADKEPHWKFPSLEMNLKDLNVKSEEKISLSSPGVKADFHQGQLNIDKE